MYKGVREKKGRSLIGFPREYCVVDIETTGLYPREDDIIEIGALKYCDGVLTDSFDSLLQPRVNYYGAYVSAFITNLTGITNEMLETAPPAAEVLAAFSQFLGGSIIVGYNVNFDVNFLYDSFERHLGMPLQNDFVDILRMAKKLYPAMPHHRLLDMTARFGIVNEHAHRALSDCEATQECLLEFAREAEVQFETCERFVLTYPKASRYFSEF